MRITAPTCCLAILAFLVSVVACKQVAPDLSGNPDPALDTLALARYRAADWKNYACELVTDTELRRTLQMDTTMRPFNTRTLPNQAFCLRSWHKADWKERESNNEKEDGSHYLNPKNSLVIQVFSYVTPAMAADQFRMLQRDRKDTYEEAVSGLGDGAVWSTSTVTLLVLKGKYVLSIALEVADQPHDNLQPAQSIAAVALRKL